MLIKIKKRFSSSGFANKKLILLFFVIGISFFLFYGPTDNMRWDPSYYFAQLRSPIIDHDLAISNEVNVPSNTQFQTTATGLIGSPWPIGPGLLWSPFFLITHLIVTLISPSNANGIWIPYYAVVAAGSAFYGIVGLIIIFYICRRFASVSVSFLTTTLCLFATPIFFYIFRQPLMAHSTGLAASAGLLLAYLAIDSEEIHENFSGLIFGILMGINVLTRWMGIVMIIFPLSFFFGRIRKGIEKHDTLAKKRLLMQVVIFCVAGILTFLPQMIYWHIVYGHYLTLPQNTNALVNSLFPVNILKIFIDTNRGIVFWLPFACIGIIGLFFIKNRNLAFLLILNITIISILIGYRKDWYSGGGYGPRYFIEALPGLSIGFIYLLNLIKRKPFLFFLVGTLSVLLIAHQAILLFAVEHGSQLSWFNLGAYQNGRPLGIHFQWDSFIHLIGKPLLWFSSRPDMIPERQTLFTSIITGKKNIKMFEFPLIGTIAVPFLGSGVISISKKFTLMTLMFFLGGILLLMISWTLFLLTI